MECTVECTMRSTLYAEGWVTETSEGNTLRLSTTTLKVGSFGNKGGVYLGLGLVKERLGKTREALPIFEQALHTA